MKKRGLVITLIVILAVVSGVFALNRRAKRETEVKTVAVSTGELVAFYSTSGALEAKSTKDYYVASPSRVLKINVGIGDSVKKGDILAELEVQDLSTQLKIAQRQYENSRIQLDSLKKVRENLNSVPTQQSQGGSQGTMSLDDQIRIQENQTEIARLNVVSIEENIKKQQRNIKAEADGVVTAVNIKEGSTAAAQMAAIVVSDASSLSVNLNINQYDITSIKEGQEAVIRFGDKEFKGVVSRVNSIATRTVSASGSDTVVKVLIDVLENDGTLKSGYDVDVDIKTGQKSGLLKIPSESIITDKNNRETVYVVENGTARIREIKTGLASDIETEVIEGLSSGERVILNPSSIIFDGAKVVEKGDK